MAGMLLRDPLDLQCVSLGFGAELSRLRLGASDVEGGQPGGEIPSVSGAANASAARKLDLREDDRRLVEVSRRQPKELPVLRQHGRPALAMGDDDGETAALRPRDEDDLTGLQAGERLANRLGANPLGALLGSLPDGAGPLTKSPVLVEIPLVAPH